MNNIETPESSAAGARRCYCIDDCDYYAAQTAEDAKQLHADQMGLDFDEADVEIEEITGELLDKQWADQDTGLPCGTLRQWLEAAQVDMWIAGTE